MASRTQKKQVRLGSRTLRYTSTGRVSGVQVEIWHDGLSEHRVLFDRDEAVLDNKVVAQLARWSEKWERRSEANQRKNRRDTGKADADRATADAQAALKAAETLLTSRLSGGERFDWASLKDRTRFSQPPIGHDGIKYDTRSGKPLRVEKQPRPKQPSKMPVAEPSFSFLDLFSSARRQAKMEAVEAVADQALAAAVEMWERQIESIQEYEAHLEIQLAVDLTAWKQAEEAHIERQRTAAAEIDNRRKEYLRADRSRTEVIEDYVSLVLEHSPYPDWMSADFDVGYVSESGLLVVDYRLPTLDRIPAVKKVTYVASRDEMQELRLTTGQHDALYDGICYQIALRTFHELFASDDAGAIDTVVFNGWVDATNPSSGIQEQACILTVQTAKAEFLSLNLAGVDPKACFRRLKGVSASKLATVTPVAPVLQLDRSDRRFVAAQNVTDGMAAGTNLAAMPWEDFEHLIRELFEEEFATTGGEVKVTQASRDRGVDAIAFDPDPIRCGKIVIQAKRYTATVDVSAVRDLYGTVMNEGANKGILVTTADYGPDAYEFVRGKPLTLLNGSNLLSLLEKHGHSARIDLREARAFRLD